MTKIKIYYKKTDEDQREPEISIVADVKTAEQNIEFMLKYNDKVDYCEILPKEKTAEGDSC